jgi:uncharacterized integral membrane protein
MLVTVVFVAFGLSNTHRVQLSFVVGQTEVRLIFLLLVSFASGVLTIFLRKAMRDARDRALERRAPDEIE